VISFTPRSLCLQGKSPWYLLDRRLGGPQTSSGHGDEERNSELPPSIEPYNPDRPVRSPVAIPTDDILNSDWCSRAVTCFQPNLHFAPFEFFMRSLGSIQTKINMCGSETCISIKVSISFALFLMYCNCSTFCV